MRKSCVFYRSFYEAIKEMPITTQGEIYASIMEYIFTGNEIDMNEPISRALFALIKPQLDANTKKYENGKKVRHLESWEGDPKRKCHKKPPPIKTKQRISPLMIMLKRMTILISRKMKQ